MLPCLHVTYNEVYLSLIAGLPGLVNETIWSAHLHTEHNHRSLLTLLVFGSVSQHPTVLRRIRAQDAFTMIMRQPILGAQFHRATKHTWYTFVGHRKFVLCKQTLSAKLSCNFVLFLAGSQLNFAVLPTLLILYLPFNVPTVILSERNLL